MNRSKHLLLTPLALVAVVAWGGAGAAKPTQTATGQPYEDAAKSAQSAGKAQDSGHWNEHFQGSGNVANTRCQGMSRGANCITAESRKDAARRAAAARDAAEAGASASATNSGYGGNTK